MRRRASTRRMRPAVAGVLAAILLVGCTGGGGDDEPEVDGAGETTGEGEPAGGIDLQEGPAPSVTVAHPNPFALRVDQIVREGEQLRLGLTMAVVGEQVWRDEWVTLITDGGIALPELPRQERTIPAGSQMTVELVYDGVTEQFSNATLQVLDTDVALAMPEEGQTLRWRPAPLRQAGLQDALLRDGGDLHAAAYTFRTEGMISEVTYWATLVIDVSGEMCRGTFQPCFLEDSAGTRYPQVGPSYPFERGDLDQVRGTMRFLGEIPPDETSLVLTIGGVDDAQLEHEFELPRAEDSPLQVSAEVNLPEPFDVGQSLVGTDGDLELELGEMSFYEDRIQLDVVARPTRGWELSINTNRSAFLRDPSGFHHRLATSTGDPYLRLEDGEAVELTLVFIGRAAPDVDAFDLSIIDVQTTIDVPGS